MKKSSKNGGQRAQIGNTDSRASRTEAQQRADDYEKQLIMSMQMEEMQRERRAKE